MGQSRIDIEKRIHALELELASETDSDNRAELREHLAYLRDKALTVAAQEYAADVRDDYRFRQY